MQPRDAAKVLLVTGSMLVAPLPGFVATALEPGHPAPACRLGAIGGAEPRDLGKLKGQVVYVDFWASWCTACEKSLPMMNALQRELGGRGLQILGVNVDERAADAVGFLKDHPVLFAVGADPKGECAEAFDVTAMPSGFLIDRDGVVRFVVRGFRERDAEELRREVEKVLGSGGVVSSP